MKVLMAVDGSDESLRAVQEVGRLLHADRDQVTFYTRAPEFGPAAKSSRRIAHNRELLASAILVEAAKRLPKTLTPKSIVGINDPRRGIVLAGEQSDADLIVVGARGLGMVERLLMGSVSSAVAHSSRIPVWVNRARTGERAGFRVLVACHDPEAAWGPSRLLSRFSWPESTAFIVLTTTMSFYGTPVPQWLQEQARSPEAEELVQRWAREQKQEMQAVRNRLDELVSTFHSPLNRAKTLVVEGDPAQTILTTIVQEEIDLVIVGSHTHQPLVGSLLGSTAEAVLNYATCSVLVMPHQEQP